MHHHMKAARLEFDSRSRCDRELLMLTHLRLAPFNLRFVDHRVPSDWRLDPRDGYRRRTRVA